jgi:hypothetical protein
MLCGHTIVAFALAATCFLIGREWIKGCVLKTGSYTR